LTAVRWLLLMGLMLGLIVSVGGAAAHENKQVGEGSQDLAPGEALVLPVEIHYHRLVGEIKAGQGAEVVVKVGPEGQEPSVVAGPGGDFLVDALVTCCKDVVWSPYEVHIVNQGSQSVHVEYRLVFLHDGFAVIAEDAEPGALLTTLLPFVGVSGWLGYLLWRKGPKAGPVRKAAWWAGGAHGAMWLIGGGAGIYGMMRYGTGPVSGAIAAAADMPWIQNEILTTQDLVLGSGIVLWVVSVAAWTAAARRAGTDPTIGWLGVALGAGSVLACALWVLDYGYFLAPVLIALSTAALPLVGGMWMLRRERNGSSPRAVSA
jgi:hypothetical protein